MIYRQRPGVFSPQILFTCDTYKGFVSFRLTEHVLYDHNLIILIDYTINYHTIHRDSGVKGINILFSQISSLTTLDKYEFVNFYENKFA